jgi:magnesium transporter
LNNQLELEKLIDEKQFNLLRNGVTEVEPADIATMIEHLPTDKGVLLFRILPKNLAAEVFANLEPHIQQSLIGRLSDAEIVEVLEEMFLDDAVDFIEEMPATIAAKILSKATEETREKINHLLKYPDNSAGTKMTVEYVSLKRDMTVTEAFNRIRKIGPDKETIYTCYVTDSERKLKGVISVRTLLLSGLEQIIGEIMDTNLIITHTDTDQEEVARIFEKYDLLNIPVIDSESRLVGIITVDDIIDVVHEEATEDFERMAAMAPSDKPYLKTGIFKLAKNRITWLVLLMVAAMLTGGILEAFEDAIAAIPLLVVFIPMLMDTGGNSGAQSSTMIIRGLALGEIKVKDFLKIIWKETRVGLTVGLILSTINSLRLLITYILIPTVSRSGDTNTEILKISLVVSATLLFTVMMANIVGGILTIIAKKCKIDPAVMAAPLITTIVDASALLVYFGMARLLLGV